MNRNYRQQAGNRLQWSQPPCVYTLCWLASNAQLTHSTTVLELACSNRSPGSAELPGPEQTHGYAPPSCSSRSSGTQSVACLSLCASLLHQGKGLFLARGLSSHTLPFKEWSAGSAAGTHSNSLLIQRLQKKKITGVSLLFPPSLSLGLHFSRFTLEFILTITRQQS